MPFCYLELVAGYVQLAFWHVEMGENNLEMGYKDLGVGKNDMEMAQGNLEMAKYGLEMGTRTEASFVGMVCGYSLHCGGLWRAKVDKLSGTSRCSVQITSVKKRI